MHETNCAPSNKQKQLKFVFHVVMYYQGEPEEQDMWFTTSRILTSGVGTDAFCQFSAHFMGFFTMNIPPPVPATWVHESHDYKKRHSKLEPK